MAHFFGTLKGNRGEATRCGAKSSGIEATVASWYGGVWSRLYEHEGQTYAMVRLVPWRGQGVYFTLYDGPVDRSPFPALEALTGADKED